MEILNMNAKLTNLTYKFESIRDVQLKDKIELKETNGKIFKIMISRNLYEKFGKGFEINISMEVSALSANPFTIDEIKKAIMDKSSIIDFAYSKISLLIAEITQMSFLGPIITVPTFVRETVDFCISPEIKS